MRSTLLASLGYSLLFAACLTVVSFRHVVIPSSAQRAVQTETASVRDMAPGDEIRRSVAHAARR